MLPNGAFGAILLHEFASDLLVEHSPGVLVSVCECRLLALEENQESVERPLRISPKPLRFHARGHLYLPACGGAGRESLHGSRPGHVEDSYISSHPGIKREGFDAGGECPQAGVSN